MLGFYHKGDRAVIDRYVLNKEADIENYGLWFWDPINFTNRLGWYQVFIVHRGNSMSLYLFEPYGRMEKLSTISVSKVYYKPHNGDLEEREHPNLCLMILKYITKP